MYVTIRKLILRTGYMAVMSKICLKWLILGDFWRFLGPLESKYNYITNSRCHMNDYFGIGILHNACANENFNQM